MSSCRCGCGGGNNACRRNRSCPTGPTGAGGPTGFGYTGPTGDPGAPGTPGSDAAGYLKWSGTLAAASTLAYLADTGEALVTVGGADYPIEVTASRPSYPFGRTATIEDFFVNLLTVLTGNQTVAVSLLVNNVIAFTANYSATGLTNGIQAATPAGSPAITPADILDVEVTKTGTFTGTVNVSATATFG